MNNLKDKIILVTGGSQGLGEAICKELCENKAIAISADIKEEQAKKVAKDIVRQGGRAYGMYLNVTDEKNVRDQVKNIIKQFGKIDVLINNAGVDVTKSVNELTIKEWDSVLGVNLRGPFVMSKTVLPIMSQQKNGHIINITSTASKRAWPNASAYHASKWGLLGFSHSLYTEAREHNVKVTAVIAGGMKTPFILDRFPDVDINTLQDPKNVADTIKFVLTQPDETAIPEIMVIPRFETSWP